MLCLSDHFTTTAVISLPAREDRRRQLQAHLHARHLTGTITWVEASNGANPPPPPGWQAGQGAWGCLQSHLTVLRQALADGAESVLVLEDDVFFHTHTATALPAFLRAVPPGWGQIYLGGQHLRPARPGSHPLVVIPANLNRAHAYAVSRTGLPAVIQWLERTEDFLRPNWHLDHQFGVAHEASLWPVYAPSWWLAGQESSASDICNAPLRRRWWHPRRWALRLPIVLTTPGEELPPATAEALYFGKEDTVPDLLTCPASTALSWLHDCAQQALDHGCLPALRLPPDFPLARLRPLWPAGIIPTPCTAPALAAYPFNGLFPHPFATLLSPTQTTTT